MDNKHRERAENFLFPNLFVDFGKEQITALAKEFAAVEAEAFEEAANILDNWDILKTDDNGHVNPGMVADEIRERAKKEAL